MLFQLTNTNHNLKIWSLSLLLLSCNYFPHPGAAVRIDGLGLGFRLIFGDTTEVNRRIGRIASESLPTRIHRI